MLIRKLSCFREEKTLTLLEDIFVMNSPFYSFPLTIFIYKNKKYDSQFDKTSCGRRNRHFGV